MAITLQNDNLDTEAFRNGEASSGTVRANIAVGTALLVLWIFIDDTTEGDFSSISDEDGNTFDLRVNHNNGNRNLRIYTVTNPTANSDNTITVNFTSATDFGLDCATYDGVDTTTPFQQSAVANGTNNAPQRSLTADSDDSMMLFCYGMSNNSALSVFGTDQIDNGTFVQAGGEKNCAGNSHEIYAGSIPPDSQGCLLQKAGSWICVAVEINAEAVTTTPQFINMGGADLD